MKAMMLLIVEVPTIDHVSYIHKEAERLVSLGVNKVLFDLPRSLKDKAYVSNVVVQPFGEDSTCAALAEEVQRLHTVVAVLERKAMNHVWKDVFLHPTDDRLIQKCQRCGGSREVKVSQAVDPSTVRSLPFFCGIGGAAVDGLAQETCGG